MYKNFSITVNTEEIKSDIIHYGLEEVIKKAQERIEAVIKVINENHDQPL